MALPARRVELQAEGLSPNMSFCSAIDVERLRAGQRVDARMYAPMKRLGYFSSASAAFSTET